LWSSLPPLAGRKLFSNRLGLICTSEAWCRREGSRRRSAAPVLRIYPAIANRRGFEWQLADAYAVERCSQTGSMPHDPENKSSTNGSSLSSSLSLTRRGLRGHRLKTGKPLLPPGKAIRELRLYGLSHVQLPLLQDFGELIVKAFSLNAREELRTTGFSHRNPWQPAVIAPAQTMHPGLNARLRQARLGGRVYESTARSRPRF
jgi:hypothetical protein